MDNNYNLMNNMFYDFDSKGYMNTVGVSPVVFEETLKREDESPNGGRKIHWKLAFGDYPDSLKFPLEFIVIDGRKIRDVLEMRWPCLFLISEDVKRVFLKNGLTGWRPYDVVIRGKSGEEITGFCGFSVTGRIPDDWEVGKVSTPDFFLAEPAFMVCVSKVVKVLNENKIKDFDTRLIDRKFCERIINMSPKSPVKTKDRFFEKVYASLESP